MEPERRSAWGGERWENARERWRVFWRGATTPWLVVVWGIVLLWLLGVVNSMGYSGLGGLITPRLHGHGRFPTGAIMEIDGIEVAVDSEDPRRIALEEAGINCPVVKYVRRTGDVGLWAPVWSRRVETFNFLGLGPVSNETPERRVLFYDYLVGIGERPDPALKTRNVNDVGIVWAAQGVNAISLFVLCAFVGSARRCFVKTMDRRTRRLLAGECPKCTYPFAGLPTDVCPECGERVG
jgi:hypothetical protein